MASPSPLPVVPDGRPRLSAGFLGIIVFKFAKSASFFLLGAVALRIARLPHHSEPLEVARLLGVNSRSVLVQHLSMILSAMTARQVEAVGAACFLIGLVFAAEGTLLSARVPWAPYFTIVLTALGIPPELIEIARRPESVRRYALLAINVATLVYLWRRRNEFRSRLPD
jgi:uncharacterized membrane protein (DUF2068 family)